MIGDATWRHHCDGFVGQWPEPYLEVDVEGTVVEWNARAEQVFGWSRDELVGRPLSDLATLPHPAGGLPDGGSRRFDLRDRTGRSVHVEARLFATGPLGSERVGGFFHPAAPPALWADRATDGTDELDSPVTDALTGLSDRARFEGLLARALDEQVGAPGSVAVVLLDLDRFKAINASLGHDRGDRVLRMVGQRLKVAASDAVDVARSAGDEFLFLFRSGRGGAGDRVAAFAERVRLVLSEPFRCDEVELFIDASAGLALNTFGVSEATVMLANAESAMYAAKDRGRSSFVTYGEPLRIRLLDRMSTEHSLHRALERSELELHYQPVVELAGVTTVGMEALVRWHHPAQGLVSPYRFIAVAEESGLIIPIGAWVLEEACHQLSHWQHAEGAAVPGSMEVNLSARQIDDPRIISTVEGILERTGLPPAQLTLEITESALMQDATSALWVLRALKELGVLLAIDDFGTGYSSLSYLQHFPLDLLKVDQSFVQELGVSAEGEEIVGAVIKLAHALGLQVVAEGVETTGQLEVLRSFQCDLAQGYLFSRPRPASEIVASFGLPLSA